jgi:hypothetical protein
LGGWQLERGGHNKKDMEENDQVVRRVCLCKGTTHYIYYALRVTKARVTEEVRSTHLHFCGFFFPSYQMFL